MSDAICSGFTPTSRTPRSACTGCWSFWSSAYATPSGPEYTVAGPASAAGGGASKAAPAVVGEEGIASATGVSVDSAGTAVELATAATAAGGRLTVGGLAGDGSRGATMSPAA